MNNQEWEEKLQTITDFYNKRMEHLEYMLEKTMEMNTALMEQLAKTPIYIPPTVYGPIDRTKNPDPSYWRLHLNEWMKCPKCGLSGANGYVCPPQ